MTLSLTLPTLCTLRVFQPIKTGGYGGMDMHAQNDKVMQMSDTELKDIIKKGDRNTFLHFQAEREYKARHKGGKRKGELKEEDEFLNGMPEYSSNRYWDVL